MPSRLRNLKVNRIALVDFAGGMDKRATGEGPRILLAKRAEPDKAISVVVQLDGKTIGNAALPADDVIVALTRDLTKAGRKISAARLATLADLRDALAALIADTTPADKEPPLDTTEKKADLTKLSKAAQDVLAAAGVTELTDEQATKFLAVLPIPPMADPAKPEDVLKSAPPELRALVEKAQADVAKAQKEAEEATKIAKAERDQRVTREFIAKAQTLDALPGMNADDFGQVLKGIAEKAPEDWVKLEPLLKSAHAAIKTGALYVEKGRGGDGGGSPYERALTMAKEKVAKSLAKTEGDALADVWRENPSLYTEYRNEMATRIAGRSSE